MLPDPRLLDGKPDLNDHQLHVFVAGPGVGEGVAVRLPSAGWLLVDGCSGRSADRAWPLQTLAQDDPVEGLLFTHPHADHADGFDALVERYDAAWIGVTGLERGRTLAPDQRSGGRQ